MMKTNYLSKLIFYLKENRDLNCTYLLQLKDIYNYCKSTFNKESATDTTTLIKLEKLIDKIDYVSKYLDVSVDFYEDK